MFLYIYFIFPITSFNSVFIHCSASPMIPGAVPGMLMPASAVPASAASSAAGAPTTSTASRPLFPAAAAQVRFLISC